MGAPNPDAVEVHVGPGEDADVNAAKALTGPCITNACALKHFAKGTTGEILLPNIVTALCEASKRVQKNDMTDVEAMLTSQAMALNAMFGELSCRSAGNFDGSYFEAGERYFKMAMKAQNQCRMTLETLSTIKNPPVVYAKQANIAHGPQQVNNEAAGRSRAEKKSNSPNKLLEQSNEILMDAGAPGATGDSNSQMEALGEIDRPSDN